jgi:hypothetical protein
MIIVNVNWKMKLVLFETYKLYKTHYIVTDYKTAERRY